MANGVWCFGTAFNSTGKSGTKQKISSLNRKTGATGVFINQIGRGVKSGFFKGMGIHKLYCHNTQKSFFASLPPGYICPRSFDRFYIVIYYIISPISSYFFVRISVDIYLPTAQYNNKSVTKHILFQKKNFT